jgi:thymidylate kinase
MNKQTIIVLEGHDKSGKTHIAAALSAELNIPSFKAIRSRFWWGPIVKIIYLVECIMQFIEQSGTSIILDRWIPSDYVYSKLFDRDISYRKIWEIDERLSKLNTTIVFCYKKDEKFIHDVEDEMFINESQYRKMTELYRDYSHQSKVKNILFLDTSDENLVEQLKTIKSYIKA